jgi:hypothetical protein
MRKVRKLKIKKKYKYGLISLCIIAAAVLLFFMMKELIHPGETRMDQSVYHYRIEPITNYEVTLKPNHLYETNTLGEGKFYFTELVDTINANFSYEYNGDTECDIAGEYKILGVMEGYIINSDKDSVTIWKRPYILETNTSLNSKDGKLSISNDISIKLEDYNTMAEEIVELTKTPAQFRLILTMEVALTAKTEYGIIEEQSSPSLTIPVYTNLFEISKAGIEGKEEDIKETVVTQLPVNKTEIILFGVLAGASTISLLFIIFFVHGEKEDPLEKKVRKIFKDHGNRLVALVGGLNRDAVKCIFAVKDMHDLVKIADELEKPILYEQKEDLKEIKTYYLIHDDTMYVYDIKESTDTSNEEALEHTEDQKKDDEKDIGIAG